MHATQMSRIVAARVESIERDALIGAEAGRFIDWQRMKPCEIDVAAIHHVNGAGLRRDQIQRERIAHFAVGNMDKAWDWAAQIKQRVHFDGCFRRTKIGPRKQRQTQIDRRAVERVNSVREIKPYVVIDVNFACSTDQDSGNVRPYAPVSPFVCIGQRRPCNGLTQSHAIQLRWLCAKTCFDIAQALAIHHLRERHDAKLFTATETADANIAAIARDDSIETRTRHEIHNLPPRSEKSGKLPQNHQAEFKSTPNESSSNVLLSKDYPSYPVRLTGQ